MPEIRINTKYEIYQIIKDFGEPLEIFREAFQNAYDEGATETYCNVHHERRISGDILIIDIWNNGEGLPEDKVGCFFDLANSNKIDDNYNRLPNKIGYKGHGAKIFFNSDCVQIYSKGEGYSWAAELNKPLSQIEEKQTLEYKMIDPKTLGFGLPDDWESGFFVRIKAPQAFLSINTQFKLNHEYLRDYIKWYTVFGTIKTLFDEELKKKNITLFLRGLEADSFIEKYKSNDRTKMDPPPVYYQSNDIKYEVITLGHYFPEARTDDNQTKAYTREIGVDVKQHYKYYSNQIIKTVSCASFSFNFVISIEGYETKRKYDILLSRRGRASTESTHTDSERYGLWACIGGIPVEKIDDWIEGGKGTYTYIQGFVDCDQFSLTANRGSIRNTDVEKIGIIKEKLNREFKELESLLKERLDIEESEKIQLSIESDMKELKNRYKSVKNRKKIILPVDENGREMTLIEPSQTKYNGYSESETMVLLLKLIDHYPDLFTFNILDYNTRKGIDFVVEDIKGADPKYIELKGTLRNHMNHPFQLISIIICYDYDVLIGEELQDDDKARFKFESRLNDSFVSNDVRFNNKPYTGYILVPEKTEYRSIQVIVLKNILESVIEARIE